MCTNKSVKNVTDERTQFYNFKLKLCWNCKFWYWNTLQIVFYKVLDNISSNLWLKWPHSILFLAVDRYTATCWIIAFLWDKLIRFHFINIYSGLFLIFFQFCKELFIYRLWLISVIRVYRKSIQRFKYLRDSP